MSLAEVQGHRALGARLLTRGLLVPARDEFAGWFALVEDTGDPALMIPPLNALTAVAYTGRELDAAMGHLQRALALCSHPSASAVDVLKVYMNLLNVATDLGRLDDAQAYAAQAQTLGPNRDPNLAKTYWLNLSKLHYRRQEWVPMQRAADKALKAGKAAGDLSAAAKAQMNRGIAHLELGASRLAERDLRTALRFANELEATFVAYAHAELGRLHFGRNDCDAALEAGREALNTLLNGVGAFDKEEVARVSRLFGAIFAQSGQRNLALKYLNRAAAYFSQLGLHADWQRATELIRQVLAEPMRPTRSHLLKEVHQLDFLTAVLDQIDDLESVDPYLRGHSERVAALAVVLGEDLGLPAEELVTLSHAARLADVGMIAVDAEVLSREGPLTAAERRRVDMHTTIGEEMVRPFGLHPWGLLAIRHHHERYDGQGRPDGLKGEAIPLPARIVAVVDVYDSLTSDRHFRRALRHVSAMEELRAMAGHKLDPMLVDRFLRLNQV
ncbi:MAG TPA: HD-GYP domain-containing protein [Symbiobacteriaceae bacterium]|jgi:HD-GYP domain-containing protein (c-di-GMP phosphodiesterase class II)